MHRHPLTLLVSATAVAVLAGCASPSATTPATRSAAAPVAAPAPAAPPAAATPPAGSATGVDSSSTRAAALPPAPSPAPQAPALPETASVFFDFDAAAMRQADLAVIERFGRYLAAVPAASARVEGHADERGSSEYNLALGQRRAQAVVDALQVLGVAERRVEAVSYGEERPRAAGSNEQAWAQNRRADLSVAR
jgi:peptidoglycan-associated lipoprotein